MKLIFDSGLGLNPKAVRMIDLLHVGDEVGHVVEFRPGTAAGENQVKLRRLLMQQPLQLEPNRQMEGLDGLQLAGVGLHFRNCRISTFSPCPEARNAFSKAAEVLPLPSPVNTHINPLRRTSSFPHAARPIGYRWTAGSRQRQGVSSTIDCVRAQTILPKLSDFSNSQGAGL